MHSAPRAQIIVYQCYTIIFCCFLYQVDLEGVEDL